jgi:hypothetical protein
MPSTDHRHEFNTAAKDIWKHRVINSDWSDYWVFADSRFALTFLLRLIESCQLLSAGDI